MIKLQDRENMAYVNCNLCGADDFKVVFPAGYAQLHRIVRCKRCDLMYANPQELIDAEEFKAAVEKAIVRIKKQQLPVDQIEFLKEIKSNQKTPDKLTIPTAEGYLFIGINDIFYCHAVGNYTEFHITTGPKIVSSYTLGYYAEMLASRNFFRVHRSYLVNLAHIKMYKKGTGGTIIMHNGDEIEVSRNSKEEFLKILKL